MAATHLLATPPAVVRADETFTGGARVDIDATETEEKITDESEKVDESRMAGATVDTRDGTTTLQADASSISETGASVGVVTVRPSSTDQ